VASNVQSVCELKVHLSANTDVCQLDKILVNFVFILAHLPHSLAHTRCSKVLCEWKRESLLRLTMSQFVSSCNVTRRIGAILGEGGAHDNDLTRLFVS
jgi:hypothetical protein